MPDLAEPLIVDPTTTATPLTEEESLAAHRASFSPEARRAEAEPPDVPSDAVEDHRPVERHRAKSQRATANDYQDIAALTKELRTVEGKLVKLKPDSGAESPRVLALRRQIKGLRSEIAEAQPPSTPVTPAVVRSNAEPLAASTATFSETEPVLGQFENEADPYAAWQRALARYDRRKDAWDSDRAAATVREREHTAAQTAAVEAEHRAYGSRLEAFRKTHPDFQEKLSAVEDRQLPPALIASIVKDDNGPAILYALLSDPVFLDEMHLLSDGKAVTETSVALLRRRLNAQLTRTTAAVTGSASTMTPSSWTSRPPNPVRTSPLTTGDDPPGDGHSLADHRKHFGPKPRR